MAYWPDIDKKSETRACFPSTVVIHSEIREPAVTQNGTSRHNCCIYQQPYVATTIYNFTLRCFSFWVTFLSLRMNQDANSIGLRCASKYYFFYSALSWFKLNPNKSEKNRFDCQSVRTFITLTFSQVRVMWHDSQFRQGALLPSSTKYVPYQTFMDEEELKKYGKDWASLAQLKAKIRGSVACKTELRKTQKAFQTTDLTHNNAPSSANFLSD